MTQVQSRSNGYRAQVVMFIIGFLLSLVNGWMEVRWIIGALPAWFYGYAALVGVLFSLTAGWQTAARLQQPFWRRAVLLSVSWGVPVMAALYGPRFLDGSANSVRGNIVFFSIWSVAALIYGFATANSKTKDWL